MDDYTYLEKLAKEKFGLTDKDLQNAKDTYEEYRSLQSWARVAKAIIACLLERQGGQATLTEEDVNRIAAQYTYHIRSDTAEVGTMTLYLKTKAGH